MEKVRPLHHHNSSDLAQDMEADFEMETNTNELEKIIMDLAHSIRMNGLVCKLLDFLLSQTFENEKWILLLSFTGVADDVDCIAIACLWN